MKDIQAAHYHRHPDDSYSPCNCKSAVQQPSSPAPPACKFCYGNGRLHRHMMDSVGYPCPYCQAAQPAASPVVEPPPKHCDFCGPTQPLSSEGTGILCGHPAPPVPQGTPPQVNCPTSARTGQGDCGETFTIGGVTHSCKYMGEDHEGPHWCNCQDPKRRPVYLSKPKVAQPSASPTGQWEAMYREQMRLKNAYKDLLDEARARDQKREAVLGELGQAAAEKLAEMNKRAQEFSLNPGWADKRAALNNQSAGAQELWAALRTAYERAKEGR